MELKFIWIEEYKNIKKTGFNFNHSIDEAFAFIDNELIISPKLNNPPKNFFKGNISSVTAIVGKNGSGKTNLAEFINYNLAHVSNGGLLRYKKGNKGIIIISKFIFCQESILIKNIGALENNGYEILTYENVPLDKHGGRKWSKMSKNKYIYYSPAFESRYINLNENLTNISTSYLAFNDININFKHYNTNKDSYSLQNENNTDSLQAHYLNERLRESDFILNFDCKEYIGESPVKLTVSIDSVEENKLLRRTQYYKTGDEQEILERKLWNELSELEPILYKYEINELKDYKLPENDRTENFDYYEVPFTIQKDIFRNLFLVNLFKVLLKTGTTFDEGFFRSFIYDTNKVNNSELIHTLQNINEKLLSFINSCRWEEKIIMSSKDDFPYESLGKKHLETLTKATLDITTPKQKKTFQDLLNLCKEITQNRLFFHYQFSNKYSSGQQNLLTIYSRFYWAKNEILEFEKRDIYKTNNEHIIIFIDEGEVALHPEWQRLFFNKIINFLSEIFDDRKIQLLLTTHSPFVLSDIPKDNVLFLKRDREGFTKSSNIDRENTFGANIYSLLSDSFFMDNTIGKFAELKLKEGLELLTSNGNDYSSQKISELEYLIKSIGEPLIKEQFEYLYQKKLGNDEVTILRNKIIQLENQLQQKRDDSDKN